MSSRILSHVFRTKKIKERKEKKYERVRGKRLLGGRWLEPLGEVGGQKTSEKSSVELDGVRWYSQTVRQRRQTDRHAGRNENNNTQRGPGP